MYDSIYSLEDKAQAVRTAMAFDFNSISCYAEDEQSLTILPSKDESSADSEG
jgi:hypothetical protein